MINIKKLVARVKNFAKHPLIAGSSLMIGGSMFINIINYVYHVVMGRILGPVGYGTLSSIFALLYIITIIPTSASNSIVKFISAAKDSKEVASIYYGSRKIIFIVAFVLSIVILIFSTIIAKFLNIDNVLLVVLISPVLFLSLITLVNQATLQGMLSFFGVVGPNLVSSIIKFVLGVILVILGWSVFGAIGAIVVGVLIAYFLSEYLIKRAIKVTKPGVFDAKPLLKYSLPVLLLAIAYTSFFTTDLILVKHFFPPFEAGIYASLSILGKVIYFASQPITAVMFPIVSKRHAMREKYEKVFLASLFTTIVISFGIVLVYFLFSDLAINVLYGSKYLSARSNLVWMGLFIAFYTTSYLISNFYLSIGKIKVAYLAIATAVLQVVLIWFWHDSLFTVILVSLLLMIFNFLVLSSFLLYNLFQTKK